MSWHVRSRRVASSGPPESGDRRATRTRSAPLEMEATATRSAVFLRPLWRAARSFRSHVGFGFFRSRSNRVSSTAQAMQPPPPLPTPPLAPMGTRSSVSGPPSAVVQKREGIETALDDMSTSTPISRLHATAGEHVPLPSPTYKSSRSSSDSTQPVAWRTKRRRVRRAEPAIPEPAFPAAAAAAAAAAVRTAADSDSDDSAGSVTVEWTVCAAPGAGYQTGPSDVRHLPPLCLAPATASALPHSADEHVMVLERVFVPTSQPAASTSPATASEYDRAAAVWPLNSLFGDDQQASQASSQDTYSTLPFAAPQDSPRPGPETPRASTRNQDSPTSALAARASPLASETTGHSAHCPVLFLRTAPAPSSPSPNSAQQVKPAHSSNDTPPTGTSPV